jgi:hypothetical protein
VRLINRTCPILLPVLLVIAAGPVQAQYCMDYSSSLQKFVRDSGGSNTRACWSTKEECIAYKNKNQFDTVHKYDFSGDCYPCTSGCGPSGPSGMGGMGGITGTSDAAIKQAIVGSMLNAALNPPPPPKQQTTTQPSPEVIAQQQKYKQQKLAEEAAQQAAFSSNQQKLLSDMKGDVAQSKPNAIDLKMPSAVSQLSLLEREGRQAATSTDKDKRSSWENPPKNLPAAMTPNVPAVPQPVSAEDEIKAKHAQDVLKNLLNQIGTSRQNMNKLDQEVKQLEETVKKEEQKAATEKKPDDDALRKAREALERAKQNREKTAAELKRLEDEAAEARSAISSTTATPSPAKE